MPVRYIDELQMLDTNRCKQLCDGFTCTTCATPPAHCRTVPVVIVVVIPAAALTVPLRRAHIQHSPASSTYKRLFFSTAGATHTRYVRGDTRNQDGGMHCWGERRRSTSSHQVFTLLYYDMIGYARTPHEAWCPSTDTFTTYYLSKTTPHVHAAKIPSSEKYAWDGKVKMIP